MKGFGLCALRCLVVVSVFLAASPVWAGTVPYRGGGGAASGAPYRASGSDLTDDQGTCATLKPAGTDASVDLVFGKPDFDNSASFGTLKDQGVTKHMNWASEAKLTNIWLVDDIQRTGGIAGGGVIMDFDLETTPVPVDQYGVYYCSFFSKLHIKIVYAEHVMIPSQFEQGSCAYAVIKTHEQMLIDANRKAMETYVTRLRGDLPGIVDDIENGFSGRDNTTQRGEAQKADVIRAVDLYIQDTVAEKIKELVAIINTPAELKLRTDAISQCGGAPPVVPQPQEQ